MTGELAALGLASGFPEDPTFVGSWVNGQANARLRDTVTIDGPFSGSVEIARVGLRVHGTLDGFALLHSEIQARNAFSFSPSLFRRECYSTFVRGCLRLSPDSPVEVDYVSFLDYPFSAENPSFVLVTGLGAVGRNEGEADAGATAQLFIDLPLGFTFTSES
ncbi:MAG TPA: hypothetical protein VMN03_03215, partial [Burkholderiales bacterium]|nr:hypothetical protein [Burkholderiales bacterium]